MDRPFSYTGALPQTIDILNGAKFSMFGLGYGMQMMLGTGTFVDGLACLPTSPTPNLNINVQVGSIYTLTTVDANPYSDLGSDTSSIVKQGINPVVQTITITPPSTAGFSQVFLVEAIYSDVDGGAQVLSYFNASNPGAPFSGPNNSGTSNFTIRRGICTISLKAGVAAATGSQVTPAPDPGYVGLFAVTVANGQTQITSPNIVQLPTAPIVGAANKLPAIPSSVQNSTWVYAADTSAGGAAVATNGTTSTSSAVLNFASVPSYVAVGMKAFDLTTVGAITGGQTVLSKTSNTVTLTGNVNATVNSADLIAFSNNALVASVTPPPASLVTGMLVNIQASGTNSGAATLNLNGLGAVNIHRGTGANLAPGDITANEVLALVYDGASWQTQNFTGGSGGGSNTTTVVSIPYGSDSSTSSNTITVTPSPALPSSIAAGQPLIVKLANPITGPTTIATAGVTGSPFPVISFTGQPLTFGSGSTGEMLWMLFDGANFQIVNPPQPLQQNLTIFVDANIGNDSLDGSQATVSGTKGPLRHIQTAVTKAFNYPSSQFVITIQVANGTYAEAVTTPQIPGPALIINGNAGSPSSVIVTGANNAHTFQVIGPNVMTVQNLKGSAANTWALTPPCVFAAVGAGATMKTSGCVSGAATGSVHLAFDTGSCHVSSHFYAGNSSYALWATQNGSVGLQSGSTYTINTSITLSQWANAAGGGQIAVAQSSPPNFVNPGSVTGQKFLASLNGVINSFGQGVNYFPGSTAGSVVTGGQYGA